MRPLLLERATYQAMSYETAHAIALEATLSADTTDAVTRIHLAAGYRAAHEAYLAYREAIAEVIHFLASDGSRAINGAALPVYSPD